MAVGGCSPENGAVDTATRTGGHAAGALGLFPRPQPSLRDARRAVIEAALVLAAARGHDIQTSIRGPYSFVAECRCGLWLNVSVPFTSKDGDDDPIRGRAVHRRCELV
jgi:hypothetical protein